MAEYCGWCEGEIPEKLKLCSGCLLLSSQFIGTDIRPFLSEKRNERTNRFLRQGRGLNNQQRIRHMAQEIDMDIPIPPILKSKRKDSLAHWKYNALEWDELIEYWRRFGKLRPGNYFFPDGSPLSIEKTGKIFFRAYRVNLPLLDIAEWLSNPLRINAIRNWDDFILLLACVATPLQDINNEEKWAKWIRDMSWRGIDHPFSIHSSNYDIDERIPPFLQYIGRKYRKEGDTASITNIIRNNIAEMSENIYGFVGESWVNIYDSDENFVDEWITKSVPILVIQNQRLKILAIDRGKPSTYLVGNDPRDWRKLMTWLILPPGSQGLEFMQGLLMNWNSEFCLWKPSLRQIRSARLLHSEIRKLGERSSLMPVNYDKGGSGLLVIGDSGMNYVISPHENKLKVDAVRSIPKKEDLWQKGIDLCIDPLMVIDIPFGDIAVGYLLALYNDNFSRYNIFTLDVFLTAVENCFLWIDDDNYWEKLEATYEEGLELSHEAMALEMDEEMENRIEEYENDLEMQRQQEMAEMNEMVEENEAEMTMEARFEMFLGRREQSANGDYYE